MKTMINEVIGGSPSVEFGRSQVSELTCTKPWADVRPAFFPDRPVVFEPAVTPPAGGELCPSPDQYPVTQWHSAPTSARQADRLAAGVAADLMAPSITRATGDIPAFGAQVTTVPSIQGSISPAPPG
jgi:hypothetical protein